jgi:hypothetical protein
VNEDLTAVPVHCTGEGCDARTWLEFPGKGTFGGAVFRDKGWSVLNEPDHGEVVFACPSCFDEELAESDDAEDAKPTSKR